MSGATSLSVNGNGDLEIETTVGTLIQPVGRAFEIDSVGNRVALGWNPGYTVDGNKVVLGTGTYNANRIMVLEIDRGLPPNNSRSDNMRWGSYYGGSGTEILWDTHTDAANNIYVAGGSINGLFPTSSGAYQDLNLGDFDCFIIKFLENRERKFATYYGGNKKDQAYSITVDEEQNIYFTGTTHSTDFSVCPSCPLYLQGSHQGVSDAFLIKLNPAGNVRQWATYFGSGGDDEGIALAYKAPFLYLAGRVYHSNTYSAAGFPVKTKSGAFNQVFHGDTSGSGYDIFAAKFHKSGTQEWTSFLGGAGNEFPTGIAVDDNQNVFISGTAVSDGVYSCNPVSGSFPVCDPGGGAYAELRNYAYDAIIVKLNTNCQLEWSTYYGGVQNDRNDFSAFSSNCITISRKGDVYVLGTTRSFYDFPTDSVPGAYNLKETPLVAPGTNYDMFVLKFNPSGIRLWATLLGGNYEDIGQAIVADPVYDRIYLGGITFSDSLMPLLEPAGSSYYYQNNLYGYYNGYFAVLNERDTIEWASYLGGNSYDVISSLNVYDAGNGKTGLIIGAYTQSVGYPVKDLPGNDDWYVDTRTGPQDGAISDFILEAGVVGIKKYSGHTSDIMVYPNPSKGLININTSNSDGKLMQVDVFSFNGNKVYSLQSKCGNDTKTIDISTFAPGIYMLNIIIEDKSHSFKLIKQ